MTERLRVLVVGLVILLLKGLVAVVAVVALTRWAAEMLDAHDNARFWAAIALAAVTLAVAIAGVVSVVADVTKLVKRLEVIK